MDLNPIPGYFIKPSSSEKNILSEISEAHYLPRVNYGTYCTWLELAGDQSPDGGPPYCCCRVPTASRRRGLTTPTADPNQADSATYIY